MDKIVNKLVEILSVAAVEAAQTGIVEFPTHRKNIKQLLEEAEKEIRASQWVRPTDRLPDNGDYILLCIGSRGCEQVKVGYYTKYIDEFFAEGRVVKHLLHYWQPLPEPPKD